MNHLSPTEWLTRYILSDRYYSASTNTVKYRAFMPIRNPDTSVLETSVYRISSLEDHEIWSIGETVESRRPALCFVVGLSKPDFIALASTAFL